ncbi:HNH endonuclease signature motif containing protein [Mycolicibacterium arenosum]|uniref:HNH endonuclease n=1 Tax=Mycolicibacterium arenosum TaxID=2952157 RepID=A0ABT1MCJ0_9MYCO|nr:HNH endonuclease signature motif containing protein [Mycolicibacterium sp. CAU 1645]MCP9276861.1 HNH endonuclease [Mycolicibacterium sp. CAU 1645]
MSTAAASYGPDLSRGERLDALFAELAEITGQRNALDGRIVDIVAEIDGDGVYGLWGNTGCRSIAALVAWKTGCSPRNAETVVAIAKRASEFPQCTDGLREGRLSLDQVGAIAENAGDGSDAHYAHLARSATVTQLRTAISLESTPDPAPKPEPKRSITKSEHGDHTTWKITLPKLDAARFDAALGSHRDALIADWKRDHADRETAQTPPMPTTLDAFMSLVDAGWDADVERRPHGQRTTVAVHLDLDQRLASLHLGPLLSDEERRYLLCDATCEVWFERAGRVIGTGRAARTVNRRLRRALEHRDRGTCVVPGCHATRRLHAHHIVHWEDGGPTELWNLVLVCPYHHRLHHRGVITIGGDAYHLTVTDRRGRTLTNASLARPPTTPPPAVAPYKGPTGERAHWWWYDPYKPNPPPTTN